MSALPATSARGPIIERPAAQTCWYEPRSIGIQWWCKRLKISEIDSAAPIPFLATSPIPRALIGNSVLGARFTAYEGLLQPNQHHENGIRWRSSCESMKQEKYIYCRERGTVREYRETTGTIGGGRRPDRQLAHDVSPGFKEPEPGNRAALRRS
jgi:hypothetical protein